jgi:hemerythrin-like domain-containing protein
MPTPQSTTRVKTTAHKTTRRPKNHAIKLLMADHAKVKKLFKEFEKLTKKKEEAGKQELAEQICRELIVHAQLEEEIFYPSARDVLEDDRPLNEATVEHGAAKDLIAQLQSMDVFDPLYDAIVKVLGEYVNHHIEEEENTIFPKVEKAKMDFEEMGSDIAERKAILTEE